MYGDIALLEIGVNGQQPDGRTGNRST